MNGVKRKIADERDLGADKFQIGETYGEFLSGLTNEQLRVVREDLEYFKMLYLNDALTNGKRAAVESSYIVIDTLLQTATSELEGREITCKKGCGSCCHLHVDVTSHEAEVILERCKEEGIAIDWLRVKKQSRRNMDTWKNLRMNYRRCVFLSGDNQCKIYSFRPAKCRLMLSVDDPIKCKDYDGGHVQFFARHAETVAIAIFNAVEGGTLAAELLKLKNKLT
jgi:Fe-S-cluster containining protein